MASCRFCAPMLGWLLVGCVQSVTPSPARDAAPPGGTMLVLEAERGDGSYVRPGDRVTVDLVGRYANGDVWGAGPLTFLYSNGAFAGAPQPVRVGAVIRTEWLRDRAPLPARVRFVEGAKNETETFAVRSDRGPVTITYTVRAWCRPMKVFVINTGLGPIESGLGCWRYPRYGVFAPGGLSEAGRAEAAVNDPDGGGAPPIVGPEPLRPSPDTAAEHALLRGDLHAAAQLGRAAVAGTLLRGGADANARDTLGMTPLHRLLLSEVDGSPYVFQDEDARLATLDTLIAHGADVRARVQMDSGGRAIGIRRRVAESTPLDLAGAGCADAAVKRLLAAGADARMRAGEISALGGAVATGCPETVKMLLDAGAGVNTPTGLGDNTPLERLVNAGAFHAGHVAVAQHLVSAGARRDRAQSWLASRLADPKPGGFGFKGRHIAEKILKVISRR